MGKGRGDCRSIDLVDESSVNSCINIHRLSFESHIGVEGG